MYPYYYISVSGADITNTVNDRLLSLTVEDHITHENDHMVLRLDDRDPCVTIPPRNARISVMMGYLQMQGNSAPYNGLKGMGVFVIDEVDVEKTESGRVLSIKAHAFGTFAQFKAQRTTFWHDMNVMQIVQDCAQRAGMVALVHPDYANDMVMALNQRDQSDMDFLARLATWWNADFKVLNGFIYFGPRDKMNDILPPTVIPGSVFLEETDCQSYHYHSHGRSNYGYVQATVWDKDKAEMAVVTSTKTASLGNAFKTLPETFATVPEAQAAVDSVKRKLDYATDTLALTTIGNPAIMSGTILTANNFRQDIPTTWRVIEAVHTIDDGGYRTEVKAEINTVNPASSSEGTPDSTETD